MCGHALDRCFRELYVVYLYAVAVGLAVSVEGEAELSACFDIHLHRLLSRCVRCDIGVVGKHGGEGRGGIACAEEHAQALGTCHDVHCVLERVDVLLIERKLGRDEPVVARQTGLIVEHVSGCSVEPLPCASTVFIHNFPVVERFLAVKRLAEHHVAWVCP